MMLHVLASLRFAGDLSPIAVGIVAVLAAIGVVTLYTRESMSIESPYSYLLPALRATAVILAILILAGPIWHKRTVVGTLGRVVFAVDTSESMSITDSGNSDSHPNRLRRACKLLLGDESSKGWLEELQKTHDLDVIGFSSSEPRLLWSSRGEEPLPTTFELTADGQRTDLSASLGTTLSAGEISTDEQESLSRGAVVMMTDGRDNFGDSAADIASQLKVQGMVVHCVGVGSVDEPPDLGIVSVLRPESVASDGTLAGNLVLKQFGMGGKPIQVRIESGGKTVWQKTINTTGDGLQNVPFELDVAPIVEMLESDTPRVVKRRSLVMDLRAAIEPLEADSTDENNAKSFRVAATTRDRQLLIVDGASRWETRYLRNLFDRDPAWTVNTVLAGPGTSMPVLVRGDGANEFPSSDEQISQYDCIVLGEIPATQFNAADLNRIKTFVAKGGGLIVVDGRYGNLRPMIEGGLAELIPVRYKNLRDRLPVGEVFPTPMGLAHPMMNLIGETDELPDFWSQLPAPKYTANVVAQEGAEVWAHAIGTGTETPWLVTRLFGSGRVFYFGADQTWRWRYKVADRFHARFWNQVLSAVMQPPYSASDDFVALGTDKIDYNNGDNAMIRMRLQDTNGKPVADATVDALLVSNDRVVASVPLTVDDPARGTYQGRTPPLAAGKYNVRIRASGFDETALQASTPIWVNDAESVEMQRIGLDRNSLVQISDAASGMYVHESSASDLLKQIKPLSSGQVVESDILIWQSFWWFWVIIALLATEWWLRKRAGLV